MNENTKRLIFGNDMLLSAINHLNFYRKHKRLPANPPQSFNDHFFRIKDKHLRDPLRVFVSDKEFVKLYVAATVGDAYNVPTIAVLRDMEQVNTFFSGSDFGCKLVIKPTHMSGECIITDKALTQEQIRKIAGWFSTNYFNITGEENYRHLEPKVIIEQYLDFDGDAAPKDYKFFCSKGKATMIQVDVGRFSDHRRALYSPDWQLLPFNIQEPQSGPQEKPANLGTMIEVAEKLSKNFGLIRVDLFSDGSKVMVGELTNVHGNAGQRFSDRNADDLVGHVFENPSVNIASLSVGFPRYELKTVKFAS